MSDFDIENGGSDFTAEKRSMFSWNHLSWKQIALRVYVSFVVLAILGNVGLFVGRRFPPQVPETIRSTRMILPDEPVGCPLDCGQHGVCQFRNRKDKTEPACLCEPNWGTFPERDCGFDTGSTIEVQNGQNVTVSKCTFLDGSGVFNNPNGACSYARVPMVSFNIFYLFIAIVVFNFV